VPNQSSCPLGLDAMLRTYYSSMKDERMKDELCWT
jgi:hypothetical protein